jgi:hypothetical protein
MDTTECIPVRSIVDTSPDAIVTVARSLYSLAENLCQIVTVPVIEEIKTFLAKPHRQVQALPGAFARAIANSQQYYQIMFSSGKLQRCQNGSYRPVWQEAVPTL